MSLLQSDNPIFFRNRPQGVLGWLHAIFIEDVGLKLLALAITLMLWLSVTGRRTPTTTPLRHIPLTFRYASDLEILGEPRDLEVTVTGNKSALDHLNVKELVAVVDVSNLRPGEGAVHLSPANVIMNLPDDVRLVEVEPKMIPIRLELRRERQIPVTPKLVGQPAPGFEVRGATIDPAVVQVRGAESLVNAVAKAETEPLPIEGLNADREFQQTGVNIADSKLTLINPVVNVIVRIGEKRIERTFAGVKVRAADGAGARPTTALVTVLGDRSVVEALRADDLTLILEPASAGPPVKRLELPSTSTGRVELKSTVPADFSLIK
jgi:YbbR domain-containing protein